MYLCIVVFVFMCIFVLWYLCINIVIMKIITFANQKGGVGKTTLSLNFVHSIKDMAKVLLVDADTQGSLFKIEKIRDSTDVVKFEDFKKNLDKYKSEYNFAVIDTPPYFTEELNWILPNSDLVIVPIKPGIMEAMACLTTVQLLKAGEVNFKVVLSQINKSGSLHEETYEYLDSKDIPYIKTLVSYRQSYIRSVGIENKDAIHDTKDKVAQNEINNLSQEILISIIK